ncbi:MAG: putative toxin-antitoxin system toxin component, PIN family [Polyangiaceae bacterium]|nr:putative toxin-antitoxin system toxin component, PIN family [Polyangiaceae bacterium]
MTPIVVVDTSVHVSSEVFSKPGSPARETISRGFARHFVSALSPALLQEIARKLAEEGISEAEVAVYLQNVVASGMAFPDDDGANVACRDPNDLFVVALAHTAKAACIVTQDADLLDPETLPAGLQPPQFLARLRELRGEAPGQRFP